MVVAKNDIAHRQPVAAICRPWQHHAARAGLSGGRLGAAPAAAGTVDAPLGRATGDRTRRAVKRRRSQDADEAITHYEVIERYPREAGRDRVRLAGRVPPRNRPHPPDPRPHGPYRPSAARRPEYGAGFKTKANLLPEADAQGRQRLRPPGAACLHAAVRASPHRRSHAFRGPLPDDMVELDRRCACGRSTAGRRECRLPNLHACVRRHLETAVSPHLSIY